MNDVMAAATATLNLGSKAIAFTFSANHLSTNCCSLEGVGSTDKVQASSDLDLGGAILDHHHISS